MARLDLFDIFQLDFCPTALIFYLNKKITEKMDFSNPYTANILTAKTAGIHCLTFPTAVSMQL